MLSLHIHTDTYCIMWLTNSTLLHSQYKQRILNFTHNNMDAAIVKRLITWCSTVVNFLVHFGLCKPLLGGGLQASACHFASIDKKQIFWQTLQRSLITKIGRVEVRTNIVTKDNALIVVGLRKFAQLHQKTAKLFLVHATCEAKVAECTN